MRILATIEKDIRITVVGFSAKEMNFILSLQEEVEEYLEWRKARGY